ncbi:MAG: hypothetical protein GY788_04875 [bacterium]|nr:hypothetical protein [bacterium]
MGLAKSLAVIAGTVLGAVTVSGDFANAAGDPANPYWPCIQRKVPEISVGMVWAGPPIREDDRAWKDSSTIASLVGQLTPRRVSLDEANEMIDAYAAGLEQERDLNLTLLFTGLFQSINAERRGIIDGIERYAKKQAALADRIKDGTRQYNDQLAIADPSPEQKAAIETMEEALLWDTRVFDERAQSLTYVCESPVLLEQRLFALARQIMSHLE